MNEQQRKPRVSVFSRVLAWVFVVACLLAVVGLVAELVRHRAWPLGVAETLMLIPGAFFVAPLFFYVAWVGRPPGWMSSRESAYDKAAREHGLDPQQDIRNRRVLAVAVAIIFGVFEMGFGSWSGVFSGDSGNFAIRVFAVIWLVVAILIWRHFTRKPPDQDRR